MHFNNIVQYTAQLRQSGSKSLHQRLGALNIYTYLALEIMQKPPTKKVLLLKDGLVKLIPI